MDKTTFEGNLKQANEAAGNPSVEDVRRLLANPEETLETKPNLQPLSVFLTWARAQIPMDWIEEALSKGEEEKEITEIKRILRERLPDLKFKNQLTTDKDTSDATVLKILETACKELKLKSADIARLQSVKLQTLTRGAWSGAGANHLDDFLMVGVTLYIDSKSHSKVVSISLKN